MERVKFCIMRLLMGSEKKVIKVSTTLYFISFHNSINPEKTII